MRLKSVRVQNYRSILDSGTVDIDPEITGIVGMTGSGKTSFLKMISGIDKTAVFSQDELPYGSATQEHFMEGRIKPDSIRQLDALFEVEDVDKPILPSDYKHIREIRVTREFGGKVIVTTIPDCSAKINIDTQTEKLLLFCEQLKDSFTSGVSRIPSLESSKNDFDSLLQDLEGADLHDRAEVVLILKSLRNLIDSGPADSRFRGHFRVWTNAVSRLLTETHNLTSTHPAQELDDLIPKPHYMDKPFDLDVEVGLDSFMADMSVSKTFHNIAVITGMTPTSLQSIRSASVEEQKSYLRTKSKSLSECLNKFWVQEKYEFHLELNNGVLRLMVQDATTDTVTSVAERSTGFKWWVAFFLEISEFMANNSDRKILLLDNPATELHDEGKADVLQFMTNASESGRLQIIYSTHERALVSPWRLDRIRAVELTRDGSKISNVRNLKGMDMAGTVLKYIGSPARYSLFGAPRMISFEGVSDTYIVSAVNEYMELHGMDYLKKDMFSLNALGGVGNAPAFCKMYKNLGLDFLIVTDSGNATENMKQTLVAGDSKFFIEIKQVTGNDGDIEDLIDSALYYAAFRRAYDLILDEIPSLDDIESRGTDKKRVNQYGEWFRTRGEKFDKTLVAQCMFEVLLNGASPDPEAVRRTTEQFQKLFTKISDSFG